MKSLAEHLGVVDLKPAEAPVEDPFPETMTDRDFCRGILSSKSYRESLQRRLLMDELPAAVELMLWNRAYGPVQERVEIETRVQPETMTDQELQMRLDFLATELRRRMNESARMNETEKSSSDEEPFPRSVH